MRRLFSAGPLIVIAALAGILSGLADITVINQVADTVSTLFIRLLRLVSTPIIFFSVLSSLTAMGNWQEAGKLGGLVFRYTLLTTIISATVALGLFLVFDPAGQVHSLVPAASSTEATTGYLRYLTDIIPSNFLSPFVEGHVISVLFLALALSGAVLHLPEDRRVRLRQFFDDIFEAVMKLTSGFLKLMPLAVWAFITTTFKEFSEQSLTSSLAFYFTCIILANLIQAFIVLPTLLAIKGLSPRHIFRGMFPALAVAFFSKSSSAALPIAMESASNRLGIRQKVASFSFPLCTTINMNACAGFILITVLFVSMVNGIQFSPVELVTWIFVATLAAIGNAGVPMGCFLLASSLLASMNVPLEIMGVIFPVYALIDMLESAINVWSDACVTCIVDSETEPESEGAGSVVQS